MWGLPHRPRGALRLHSRGRVVRGRLHSVSASHLAPPDTHTPFNPTRLPSFHTSPVHISPFTLRLDSHFAFTPAPRDKSQTNKPPTRTRYPHGKPKKSSNVSRRGRNMSGRAAYRFRDHRRQWTRAPPPLLGPEMHRAVRPRAPSLSPRA